MSKGKLENPACKLEVKDIQLINNSEGIWMYEEENCKFRIDLLWVQGTVDSISPNRDEIQLKEENKTIQIKNCLTIPGGSEWLNEGQYVMVVGYFIAKLDTNSIQMKAIKIADLSTNSSLQKLWPMEVKEAKILYKHL